MSDANMESRHLGGDGEGRAAETAAPHIAASLMESRHLGGGETMESRHLGGDTPSLHRVVEFREAIENPDKRFFSYIAETDVCRHNLPHLGQRGVIVFITFRLADSMPSELLSKWRGERETWLDAHPEPWDDVTAQEYAREFQGYIEKWLDAGHGACILARSDCNRIVSDALEYFNGKRYVLHAYIVMPNHVHVLLELPDRVELPRMLHSWKSFTAKKICGIVGASGPVWQRDYFDRLVRSEGHYRHCLDYIRKNERQMWGRAAETAAPHTAAPLMESRHLGGGEPMESRHLGGAKDDNRFGEGNMNRTIGILQDGCAF